MNTLKIEKEVTKEDVYVFTQCEKDYQKVTEIITRSGESLIGKDDYFVTYSPLNGYWVTLDSIGDKHQITIPQLAELLGVEYPLKPEQLPTLEELIAEAKSKITVKSESYPCWVEGMRKIKVYHIGDMSYMSEKLAISNYISKRLREEYL